MRVLKNVLIGLGAIFLVVLALLAWMGASSHQFRKEEAPFVEKFVADLSRRWDLADVYDRLAPPFIEQAGTPQARQLLHQFKQLGGLKSVRDLELRRYETNSNSRTGYFYFKGTFENGEASVEVTITKNSGAARVLGLYLTTTHIREGPPKVQAYSPKSQPHRSGSLQSS